MPRPDHFIVLSAGADCDIDLYSRHDRGDAGSVWSRMDIGMVTKHVNVQTGPVNSFSNYKRRLQFAIVIPVSAAAAGRLRDFCDMAFSIEPYLATGETSTDIVGTKREIPYYFTQDMTPLEPFEKDRDAKGLARLFGGPETRYFQHAISAVGDHADRIRGVRANIKNIWARASAPFRTRADTSPSSDSVLRARYNCWTGAQGLAEYVARVDLADIDPDLSRYHRAWQVTAWFAAQMQQGVLCKDKDVQDNIEKIKAVRHPVRTLTSPYNTDGVYVLDGNHAPVLIVPDLDSFTTLNQSGFRDGSGAMICPLRDLYDDNTKLFGDVTMGHPLKNVDARPDLDGPHALATLHRRNRDPRFNL
ncbi:hypothetical protein [Micavibrio aeruginosavorus]|uniref:hypothetical protein n=1 Tax=Micavibrio aeruginosavorus TaxID=349221 RepID=UPI003F4AB901